MFMFDIETLDTESTAVVLSASIIHFEIGNEYSYEDLLARALFVKFNVKEQLQNYKRVANKRTIEWWDQQHEFVRKTSLVPDSVTDCSVIDGINYIKNYMAQFPEKEQTMWARGSLDQMVIDSLCYASDQEPIANYAVWRDVRTAVDLLTETSKGGYCDIVHPTFQRHNVIKHHPTHDCALDIMMLIYGK